MKEPKRKKEKPPNASNSTGFNSTGFNSTGFDNTGFNETYEFINATYFDNSTRERLSYVEEEVKVYRPGTWKPYGTLKEHGEESKYHQTPIVATYSYKYNVNSSTEYSI